MIIAICGVLILRTLEPRIGNTATWLGDFFVLLGGIFFAIFTVFGKEISHLYSPITMNTVAYAGGALALSPLIWWEASRHPLGNISAATWLCALYLALFSSVLAYLIYYYALARVAASQYLQPVIATVMGVVILRERAGLPVIAGGLVILTGVYLAERG